MNWIQSSPEQAEKDEKFPPNPSDWIPSSERSAGAVYQPLALLVTERLRNAILDGRLRPGERIRQQSVAQEYKTSRIPVREALRQLETEGLVTIVPHSGARVAQLDFDECVEIYKIRERLEPLALAESMPNLTGEQLEEIKRLAGYIEAGVADPKSWLAADRRFHLATYAGMQSTRLDGMITSFWNTTQQYRRILLSTFLDSDFELVHNEHHVLIDVIERGDVMSAEAILRSHITRTRMRLARHRELFDS